MGVHVKENVHSAGVQVMKIMLALLIAVFTASVANAESKVAITYDDKIAKVAVENWYYEFAGATTGGILYRYDGKDLPLSREDIDAERQEATWSIESEKKIEAMVRKTIELVKEDWPVKDGDVVMIKPNLIANVRTVAHLGRGESPNALGITTDVRVAKAVALVALESGAKKVQFAEQPAVGNEMTNFLAYGYFKACDDLNLLYPGKCEIVSASGAYKFYKPSTGGLAIKEYAIPDVFMEADKLINVPVLKTHSQAAYTSGMKNIGIGTPTILVYGQAKNGLPHQNLLEVIADVNSIVKADRSTPHF